MMNAKGKLCSELESFTDFALARCNRMQVAPPVRQVAASPAPNFSASEKECDISEQIPAATGAACAALSACASIGRMHSPQTQISLWAVLPAALAPVLAIVFAITPICYAGSPSSDASNSSGSSSSVVAPGKTLSGKASYYPNLLNGHETASGDTFHQSDHTAASNKLPLGTTAKVTNLKTGKSTDVIVNDRGPALGTRKIDLTKKAAKDIGLTRKEGVAPVKIKITSTPGAAP